MQFLDDLKSQVLSVYRDRFFPAMWLIGSVVVSALLQQWILILAGIAGFLYWQIFKKDR